MVVTGVQTRVTAATIHDPIREKEYFSQPAKLRFLKKNLEGRRIVKIGFKFPFLSIGSLHKILRYIFIIVRSTFA